MALTEEEPRRYLIDANTDSIISSEAYLSHDAWPNHERVSGKGWGYFNGPLEFNATLDTQSGKYLLIDREYLNRNQ